MTYETILVETKGKVGIIRLNRPQALNALNAQVNKDLTAAVDAFEADATIMCIIITGSEKAFAAGADIKEIQAKSHMDVFMGNFAADWDRVARMRKPVIAAVAGFALGGGCELAMMCDFIIAAENAKFGQPEIKLGVIPGIGGTQRLTRAIGKAKAMDLNLTGRMMDATEAERAGLVARIVPLDRLMFCIAKSGPSRGRWDDTHYDLTASADTVTRKGGHPGLPRLQNRECEMLVGLALRHLRKPRLSCSLQGFVVAR